MALAFNHITSAGILSGTVHISSTVWEDEIIFIFKFPLYGGGTFTELVQYVIVS